MFPFPFNNLLGFLKMSQLTTSSVISDKLSKENCSLEDLLIEDEIIQEMKNPNSKLHTYLTKEKIKQLLDYILIEPIEDEQNKGHKFPFISSELLNCDSQKIFENFFVKSEKMRVSVSSEFPITFSPERPQTAKKEEIQNKFSNINEGNELFNSQDSVNSSIKEEIVVENSGEFQDNKKNNEIPNEISTNQNAENSDENITAKKEETNVDETETKVFKENENYSLKENSVVLPEINLLDYFFSFLQTENQLNYVLSGYFAKFFNTLFNKKSSYILNYIYKEKPELLEKFIFHSNRKSISELISKIFNIEDHDQELAKEPSVKIIREKMLNLLISNLISDDLELVENTMTTLSEIIYVRSSLVILLNNQSLLEKLYSIIGDPDVKSFQFVEVINLLISLMKYSMLDNYQLPQYSTKKEDENIVSYDDKDLVHSEISKLNKKYFKDILKNFELENNFQQKENSYGQVIRPLGNKRIKIIEYIFIMMNYNDNIPQETDEMLSGNPKFFELLFSYFFEFEWNNIFQNEFTILINCIFEHHKKYGKTIKYLFEDFRLIDVLLVKANQQQFIFNSGNRLNHGFWAVFIEVCLKIQTMIDHKHYLTEEWNIFYDDKVVYWKELFERKLSQGTLAETNKFGKSDDGFNFKDPEEKSSNDFYDENENKSLMTKLENLKIEDIFKNQDSDDWMNNELKGNSPQKFDDEMLQNFVFEENDEKKIQESQSKNESETEFDKMFEKETLQEKISEENLEGRKGNDGVDQ